MVNRQGSSAGKPPRFDGVAEVTRKLPDLPMETGSQFAALGKLFDTVGAQIGAYADHAAAVEGEAAGIGEAKAAVAEMRPLALRHDGTISGDAADRAATSAVEWRAMAKFHDGLVAAHDAAKGDPAAFDAAVGKLGAEVRQLAGNDPVLGELFDRKMASASEPYRRSLLATASGKVEVARRDAADKAMAAAGLDLSKKAYLAGADPKSAAALEADAKAARAAIDAAAAEGVIDRAEATRRKKALGDGIVEARLKGVFDALPDAASKTAWADGLEKRWAAGDPALGSLDRPRVEGLMAHMRGTARAEAADGRLQTALDRRVLEQHLSDDVASIRRTGQPTDGSDQRDDTRLTQILGPVDAAKWADERRAAQDWFAEAGDLARLPAEQIGARLAALEPKPGAPDYARLARLHDEASREADRILRLRAEDPAAAVEQGVKGVRDVKAGLDPQQPDTFRRMVATRLSAQAAIGIPPAAQQPLTQAEAKALAAPIAKAAPGQEYAAIQAVAGDVAARYGEHGQAVMRQLLEVNGVDRDTARVGAAFVDKLRRGEARRPDAARVDVAREVGASMKAMAPEPPPVPTRPVSGAAIDMLRARPDTAAAFDEKYGKGMARLYLEPKPTAAGTTTIAPDGTEGWKP